MRFAGSDVLPMTTLPPRGRSSEPESRVAVAPLEDTSTFADRAYAALKDVILALDIYDRPGQVRLDERRLASDLGISRTPVREAMAQLEREGFVRSVPRRGIYVVRKTKREVIEMILVWAAIESLAARFAASRASESELRKLRELFTEFEENPAAHIGEYSQANMEFHKAIIRMGGCALMSELTDSLFIHMRAVRAVTMRQDNRAERSIIDHLNIIAALEKRDADLAERLVREHTLGLAAHVEKFGDFIDGPLNDTKGTQREYA